MADDDYGDDYGDYFFDDDYLYIEDEYAIADELAEGQVPSPGYFGTNAELELERYEWDNYDFWNDLAYGSDSYFDPETKVRRRSKGAKDGATENGHKRKRASVSTSITKDKRRRIAIEQRTRKPEPFDADNENVFFRGNQTPVKAPPTPKAMESFALLPDWKERFATDSGLAWEKPMPDDMKRAAEAEDDAGDVDEPEPHDSLQDEETSTTAASPHLQKEKAVRSRKHKAKHVSRHDVEQEEGQGDMSGILSSLDPDTLLTVLRQKLGNTGMDEAAFMTVIQDMLAGNAADDAAEQLTKILLQGDSANKSATLSWLGGQGVNVDAGAEDSEEELDDTSARRVDSGSGLPVEEPTDKASSHAQTTPPAATTQRKRKPKADPGMSSVEGSPAAERRSATTTTTTRSSRKKTKS